VVGLLGPSGSGKSTLLRVIAGLLPPDAGSVCWDGEDLTSVLTHRRRFGMVFQDQQLFPHRDVAANVGFGLRMASAPKDVARARVAELLELVGLAGFEHRAVTALSGGEAQRVALARALAPEPRLLLLDEPLAALDRDLHDRLAVDLRDLLKRLHITAIHVTHDRDEAKTVADRVVTLADLRHADHRA
jgi:thiamine transport system ATP-binding protein